MAKAKTAAAPKKVKKAAKAVKAVAKAAPKADKKKAGKKSKGNAADALWKLAEHPLIGDLLAVGASAAVAAIAEQSIKEASAAKGKDKKAHASKTALKAAGTAAAAAIGQRLITEFTEVKKTKPAKA